LPQGSFEAIGQRQQMVQTTLNDENVFAPVGEWKFPAIANVARRVSLILRYEADRQVYPFDARESQRLERAESIATAAKQLDDFGIASPLAYTQRPQALREFPNFLFGGFKPQVRRFPGIGRDNALRCVLHA
jgi:hypothetical protein